MGQIKGKKVTVLGAARSGIAAARLLHDREARVFVTDISEFNSKKEQAEELDAIGASYEFGGHSQRIYEADFAVLSPGIPVRSQLVQQFLQKKIPVYSEIEVASWFCLSPIIAVTGSNGKTTTTTLIGQMLRKRYPDAIVAGNIGQPFSDFVTKSHGNSFAVVEVSSFQLETIDRFHPAMAVVLNFSPNHLDHYESYEAYLQAKWRITKNLTSSDGLVYNRADVRLSQWAQKCPAVKKEFDIEGNTGSAAYYDGKKLFLNSREIIPVSEMGLRGEHNYMNAMAAALAASLAGVSIEQIRQTLAEFNGVEHRLEFVRNIAGVNFFNDSKATTVESLSYALRSFEKPVVLIAGGKDKGSDFTTLNELIAKHVKELVLIGTAADKMAAAWGEIKPVHRCGTLEEAVQTAHDLAKSGETVLLSPACASFDMFTDFEDRGRKFKAIVKGLRG